MESLKKNALIVAVTMLCSKLFNTYPIITQG